MDQIVWVIVAVVVIAVLLAVAVLATRRPRKPPFATHSFPENYLAPYEHRIEEIERMFVNQPRESVAAAKLLVDDMLTRMGYPVRMTGEERARDLRHFNRDHSDRYRLASEMKADPTTEEMRRALKAYLDSARDHIGDTRTDYEKQAGSERRPEIAG